MGLQKSSFQFLKKLEKNNTREWFTENKAAYDVAKDDVKALLSQIEDNLNKTDEIEKAKLYRIYRDVRFSKDKTPYKTHYALSLARATAYRRGGYFIRLAPGSSMVGGGFYAPEASDLKHIRSHIAADASPLRKVLKAKKFKEIIGAKYDLVGHMSYDSDNKRSVNFEGTDYSIGKNRFEGKVPNIISEDEDLFSAAKLFELIKSK